MPATTNRDERGFSVLEMATALVILAVMAAMLVPMAASLMDSQRAGTTVSELQQIYTAIVGNPQQNTFGYLGDVGDYPAGLLDLIQRPASNPPGWNGPYLANVRVDSGILLDPFGGPIEFFQYAEPFAAIPDYLTLISKGPDRTSTNSAANPNIRANFTGTVPANSSYASGVGNADNVAFPSFVDNVGLLSYQNLGTLSYNLYNFDKNAQVNSTPLPGCPGLYTVTITSVPRGTADTFSLSYNQGLSADLVQGLYDVRVSSALSSGAVLEEQVSIRPGATLARTATLGGLDSSNTPAFTFSVVNGMGSQLRVLADANNKGTVNTGTTGTFTINGCSQIRVEDNNTNQAVDTFIYPYMDYTKRYTAGTSLFSLTVSNVGVSTLLKVSEEGLLIGTVGKRGNKKSKTLLNVRQGNTITITDQNGNVRQQFSMPATNHSVVL